MPYMDYYWLSQLYHHSPDPYIRLTSYLYTAETYPDTFPDNYLFIDEDLLPRLPRRGLVLADEKICEEFVTGVLGTTKEVLVERLGLEEEEEEEEEGGGGVTYYDVLVGLIRQVVGDSDAPTRQVIACDEEDRRSFSFPDER